jgi:hypothetical protein
LLILYTKLTKSVKDSSDESRMKKRKVIGEKSEKKARKLPRQEK